MHAASPETLAQSLPRTIATLFLLPALVIFLGLCALVFHTLEAKCRDVATAEFARAAAEYGRRVDGELKVAKLAALTLSRAVENGGDAQGRLAEALETLRRDVSWIEGAAVLTGPGRTVVAAGSDPATEAWAAELAAEALGASAPVFTKVEAEQDGLPNIRLAVVIRNEDGPQVVCLSANAALFSSLLDRERIGRTGEAFLMDDRGALLTASVLHGGILDRVDEALAHAAPEAGAIRIRDWAGARLWFSVRAVEAAPGWRLVVQRDEGEILEARDAAMARLAVFGLLALAVLGGAALATLRRVRALQERMNLECADIAEHDMLVRKLDAISQLGVGIAHEVNNPLAIIGEEAGWMQDVLKRESFRDHPDAGELRDSLRQIVTQTGRSREITHKLLSFGGKTDGTIRDTDLNTLVADVAMLRRREASGKGVEIREELAEKLPVILSEPALLRQVLIILINNCLDAMPEGGAITLSTAPVPGGGARLEVRDTGFGIPRENLGRVFDPFFTTKPPGKGAGLGLSICHGIMQRIGGRISARSVPGQGTTVTVELPMDAAARKP